MKSFVVACMVLLAACTPDDQQTGSIKAGEARTEREQSPALTTQLDSGNAAYRSRNYERALAHYRAAVQIDDEHAAGWFGIYMSQTKLGRVAAADSALQRAQDLAPGASLLQHPAKPDGHP